MDKISFRADKKSKFRKFRDDNETVDKNINIISEKNQPDEKADILSEEKKEIKIYKNRNEIFAELFDKLVNRYNIDNVSVYSFSMQDNSRYAFKKLYGQEISKYVLEKYFGYDCPVVCTNAEGMVDNIHHRARLIEHISSYVIIVSSSSYEVYRNVYDLQSIRQQIKTAFQEVEKLK